MYIIEFGVWIFNAAEEAVLLSLYYTWDVFFFHCETCI